MRDLTESGTWMCFPELPALPCDPRVTVEADSDADCLCGIPECKGHEDLGGYIAVPTLLAELFLGAPERDFTLPPQPELPIPAKAEGGESSPASPAA